MLCDYLVLYLCSVCGQEHYFEPDSLPGGPEHCGYCEHCAGLLVKP